MEVKKKVSGKEVFETIRVPHVRCLANKDDLCKWIEVRVNIICSKYGGEQPGLDVLKNTLYESLYGLCYLLSMAFLMLTI